MGEMAEYYLESEDYFEEYPLFPEDSLGPPRTIIACKFCNQKPLIWARYNNKWRLGTESYSGKWELHICPKNPLVERGNWLV